MTEERERREVKRSEEMKRSEEIKKIKKIKETKDTKAKDTKTQKQNKDEKIKHKTFTQNLLSSTEVAKSLYSIYYIPLITVVNYSSQ